MISGKITPGSTIVGRITSGTTGTNEHNKLINRDLPDQHPIEAITGLKPILDKKLDEETAVPIIEITVEKAIKDRTKVDNKILYI